MLGPNLVVKAAKKGKQKYGWKGLVVAGLLALLGKRYAKQKLGKRVA